MLLTGGGSNFPGAPDRLEEDVFLLCPDKLDSAVIANPQRELATWQGGAYLCTVPALDANWLHLDDRDDPTAFEKRLGETDYKV